MDNCDLEKLCVSAGTLHPDFTPEVTDYTVTVESGVDAVTVDVVTCDRAASHVMLSGDGSSLLPLSDGLTRVEVEVVAEDGTLRTYRVDVTRLSPKVSQLSALTVDGDVQLHPAFSSNVYQYKSIVPFHCEAVTLLPEVQDRRVTVSVNGTDYGTDASHRVPVNFGDTELQISVRSADGSNSQVYTVLVTRELLPLPVTFTDGKQQLDYECPVSLSAFYRPVSLSHSDPKQTLSRPYSEMLARRSRVHPLSDCPLGDGWKVVERDLDGEMSAAPVKCFFVYRGCDLVMKLSELGSHVPLCPHRPTGPLDSKDVTETSWYKKHFASAACLEVETKHILEVRNWEKRLQTTAGYNVNDLSASAQHHLKLYRQHLPKPGDMLQHEDGRSPLQNLETAAVYCASAIRLRSRDARLHFLLGLVLEEQHYATEMYGLQRKADRDRDELSDAKSAARQEEILAVCKLHGFPRPPTVENQLRALDKETQQLKEQGQSSRADYVQTLHVWLSKKTAKGGGSAPRDEENHSSVHRALMKYLDAWSLSPDSWEYNLHVGRLLLLQGRSRGALQHLQSGLALRPLHPALRFFTGLALLQQESRASEDTEEEAALFLQQGLEHFVSQRCSKSWKEQDPAESLSSLDPEFLRGLLTLGELQQRSTASGMSAEQVYHTAAVLAAQSVSRCVCGGRGGGQLEWVLLDAHFALLQRLHQQGGGPATVVRRCRALSALIGLSSIPSCQELLDLQEKTCQLAVVTTPRDGHALCLLGLAQLAQYGNSPNSEESQEVLAEACLSFQASIELEEQTQDGPPPEQLTRETNMVAGPAELREGEICQTTDSPTERSEGFRGPRGGQERSQAGEGGARSCPSDASCNQSSGPHQGGEGRATRSQGASWSSSQARWISSCLQSKAQQVQTGLLPRICGDSRGSRGSSGRRRRCVLSSERQVSRPPAGTRPRPVPRCRHPGGGQAALPGGHRHGTRAPRCLHGAGAAAGAVGPSGGSGGLLQVPSQARGRAELRRCLHHRRDRPAAAGAGAVPAPAARAQPRGSREGPGPDIEKHMDVLDAKCMTELLRSVYARIHDRQEDDQDLQEFFRFRCWI